MKNFFAMTVVSVGLVGCSGGGQSSNSLSIDSNIKDDPAASASAPLNVSISGVKALFVANELVATATESGGGASSSAVSYSKKRKLKSFNSLNAMEDVVFKDQNGRQVDVEVTDLQRLNADYSAIEISYTLNGFGQRPKKFLIWHTDGRLFDVSAYSIEYAQIRDGYFFTRGDSYTLYKLDLSGLIATAINNPKYDPSYYGPATGVTTDNVRQEAFLIDAGLNLYVPTVSGAYRPHIFFADNSVPFAYDANIDCLQVQTALDFNSFVYGEDGKLYAYRERTTSVGGWKTSHYLSEVTFTHSGTVCSDTLIRVTPTGSGDIDSYQHAISNYELHDRTRYTVYDSGFMKMSPVSQGGVSLAFTSRDLSMIRNSVIAGDYVYWKSANTIYRLNLTASSSTEVMIATTNLIDFKIVSGMVLFTRYLNGSDVGTYQVSAPGAAPQLLLNDDMEIDNVIELAP